MSGGPHVFVDESKRDAYVVVAVSVAPQYLADVRRNLRSLLLSQQRSVHFKKERAGRRRQLLTAMCRLPVSARVYSCEPGTSAVRARRACLEAVAEDLAGDGAERLVLEMADGDYAADTHALNVVRRKLSASFTYHHVRAPQEPVLWMADGLAWAWTAGAPWRAGVNGLVTNVRRV